MLKGEYWNYVQELFELGSCEYHYVTVLLYTLSMCEVTNVR